VEVFDPASAREFSVSFFFFFFFAFFFFFFFFAFFFFFFFFAKSKLCYDRRTVGQSVLE
jgi:hypothetical protein